MNQANPNNPISTIPIQVYPDGRMDTKNTALYLGISEKCLAHWRCIGISPPFIKRGNRVWYYLDTLNQWLNSDEMFTSTAQARLAKGGEQNG